MKATIVYVSKYGATEQVAKLIAKRLSHWDVSLVSLKDTKAPLLTAAYPAQLSKAAVAGGFFLGAFNFEKMNFFERFAIKRIAKIRQSVVKIGEDQIARFAAQLQASVGK